VDIDRNSEAVRLRREMELAARGDQAVPGSG
jgi:hypothetical protein